MPIVEAGFHSEDGKAEHEKLLRYGPTIQVTVGPMPTDEPTSEEELESALALIDTGASESCIDINLAKKLRLPVVDVQQVSPPCKKWSLRYPQKISRSIPSVTSTMIVVRK